MVRPHTSPQQHPGIACWDPKGTSKQCLERCVVEWGRSLLRGKSAAVPPVV